ncbi:MAG: B12-binding domain-containing radical SAM protein [Elusimicrobia bacterium]|nr:B12-binding domain-containing radical SAM protein [Candidatus Liberimonas magnetica]
MAKILFLQDVVFEFVGIQTLSAILKQNGHKVDLLVLNDNEAKRNLVKNVKEIKPDAVAFSIPSIDYSWSIEAASMIKKELNIPNIFGGPHPTYYPDFIETPCVDAICVGEGEGAIVDYANSLDNGRKGLTEILNLSIKENGKIFRNPIRPYVDINELPYPDRDLYYNKFNIIRDFSSKRIVATRGCPYRCTFCFNAVYQEIYRGGKGDHVRRRDPEKMIEEMKFLKKNYTYKTLSFSDENFTTNKKWVFKLLELYKKEINDPFMILGRFNELDEEIVSKLAESGCFYISVGIETGSERIRNEILKKHLTDAQIRSGAALLRKYGIGMFAYNMVGLPTETLEDAFKTLELNAEVGVNISIPTILKPIKKTELCDYIERNNLLLPGIDLEHLPGHWEGIVLNLKDRKEMENLQNLFMLGIWLPFTIPLIRLLVKLPKNFIFRSFLKFSILMKYIKTRDLGFWETVKMAWQVRKNV